MSQSHCMRKLDYPCNIIDHSPLTTMAGEQIGWVYQSKDSTSEIIFSISWPRYAESPLVETEFNKLARAEKLFNNLPSISEFSEKYKVFKFASKDLWFNDILPPLKSNLNDEYGLTGFIVAANPDMINTQKGDMLLYLQNLNVNLLMENDLKVNGALWQAGEDDWFNLNISVADLKELVDYNAPMNYVYHTPILSWEQPELLLIVSLGLLNWNYLDI